MIHIKYKLRESELHGIGLFADEEIGRGTLVYSASPELDVNISESRFQNLDPKEQEEVRYWGYWDKANNVWHVDFDNTRFINHSYNANLTQDEEYGEAHLIATRDIKKGEELTQNYLEFESVEDLERRGISLEQ